MRCVLLMAGPPVDATVHRRAAGSVEFSGTRFRRRALTTGFSGGAENSPELPAGGDWIRTVGPAEGAARRGYQFSFADADVGRGVK